MYRRTDARTLTSDAVSQKVAPVFARWGIERAWLHGSVARGTQTEFSDVDLMVELAPDAGIGMGVVRLQDELEDALGLDVDIHSVPDPRRTNPAFMGNYESSKVLVYEREAR